MGEQEEKEVLQTKYQWLIFGIGVVVLIGSIVYGLLTGSNSEQDVAVLQDEVYALENELAVRRADESTIRQEVVYKTTGIDPELVTRDEQLASNFFRPAFSWTDGEEYDSTRKSYMEELGEDSPFVKTYLAENQKIDQYNYIDVNSLQADFDGIMMYALEERDTAMDYLGVITFYMVKSEDDLVSRSNLTGSQAIVRFTVDGTGKNRTVTNVVAYPGFSELLNEE